MDRHSRLYILCLIMCAMVGGQDFKGLEYLGEIPYNPYAGQTMRLGLAEVSWPEDGRYQLNGTDDKGMPWVIDVPQHGGLGSPQAWAGDLDANGRRDLIILNAMPSNGRCASAGSLLMLLYDERGRPVPWVIYTLLTSGDFPIDGVLFLDVDQDRRPEVVFYGCGYGDPTFANDELWAHLYVAGAYEARDAGWMPVPNHKIASIDAIARKRMEVRLDDATVWQPAAPDKVPHPFVGWANPQNLRVDWLRTAEYGCEAFLPPKSKQKPMVGQDPGVTPLVGNHPCRERSAFKVGLSNGTVLDVPARMVMDHPQGRQILLADRAFDALFPLLQGAMGLNPIGPTGQPDLFWVYGSLDDAAPSLNVTFRNVATTVLIPEERSTRRQEQEVNPALVYADGKQCIELETDGIASSITPFQRPDVCTRLHGILDQFGIQGFVLQRGGEVWHFGSKDGIARRMTLYGDEIESLRFLTGLEPRGELMGVARLQQELWLTQWGGAGSGRLMLHRADGTPLTKLFAPPARGQLLGSDRRNGLLWVRWRQGIPIELIRVRAALELTASPGPPK